MNVALATVPDDPEPTEETLAPVISYEINNSNNSVTVTIVNEDPNDAELYYRYYIYDNGDVSEWMIYDGPFVFSEPGRYRIDAYACALDHTPSQMTCVEFYVLEPPVPTEKAMAPTMAYEYTSYLPPEVVVTINPSEAYSELYYRYSINDGEMTEWKEYYEPLYFSDLGQYYVQSYAVVPGKLPSEMCAIVFDVVEPPMTAKPIIVATWNEDGSVDMSIMSDAGYYQTYYYRVNDGEWYYYDGIPIRFTEPGLYTITAYAEEENMLPSDEVSLTFTVTEQAPYDFVEDGIYYKITGDDMVKVTFESLDYGSYSGVVNIPKTVTHDGVTYRVTAIGDRAFMKCVALTDVTIGGYVTTIGNAAFMYCTSLTSVELGNYVITVNEDAFNGCSALTSLTIGSGVRTIGDRAFAGCTSLASIVCKPATPPSLQGYAYFENSTMANAVLTVHPAVLDSYKTTYRWKNFAHIEASEGVDPMVGDVDGDGVLSIGDVSSLIDELLFNN